MPRVGFPRSPQDTRKTQDTSIPAVLGKTLTDYDFSIGGGGNGLEAPTRMGDFAEAAKPDGIKKPASNCEPNAGI